MNNVSRAICFAALVSAAILALAHGAPASSPSPADTAALTEAVQWIRASSKISAQYDYSMAVRVRILVFWISMERVGGGYIRRRESPEDPRLRGIEVLFGSDPAKAKGVNRWGAGTEVVRLSESGAPDPVSSAFLGFMKASKGESAAAMQAELSKEHENNTHLFDATVTRADHGRALARTTPFTSTEDYNLHQLPGAMHTVR